MANGAWSLGTSHESDNPLKVIIKGHNDCEGRIAYIWCDGGYDHTVIEGRFENGKTWGMFLTTDDRDPWGNDSTTGNPVHDSECAWHLPEGEGLCYLEKA